MQDPLLLDGHLLLVLEKRRKEAMRMTAELNDDWYSFRSQSHAFLIDSSFLLSGGKENVKGIYFSILRLLHFLV